MKRKQYNKIIEKHIKEELEFNEKVELVFFKYAYKMSMKKNELKELEGENHLCYTSKEWKKYIKREYGKDKKCRQILKDYAVVKRIEVETHCECYLNVPLVVMVTLIIMIVQLLIDSIKINNCLEAVLFFLLIIAVLVVAIVIAFYGLRELKIKMLFWNEIYDAIK